MMQATGSASPSFTHHYLDKSLSEEDETILMWTSLQLYAAGFDTVRIML